MKERELRLLQYQKEDKMQNEHPLRTSLRLMIHSDTDLIEYVGHLNDAFDIIYVL